MRIFQLFIIIILVLAGAAQAEPAKYVPYEDAAKLALGFNPDLQTLRYQEEAQRLRSQQALSPSNPEFTVNKNDLPGLSPIASPGSTVYSLSFTLGFPGKALLNSASSRN